jgi:hypothetical protein
MAKPLCSAQNIVRASNALNSIDLDESGERKNGIQLSSQQLKEISNSPQGAGNVRYADGKLYRL